MVCSYMPRDARHAEAEQGDQVALHLVDAAAEGEDEGALVGALEAALRAAPPGEPRPQRAALAR